MLMVDPDRLEADCRAALTGGGLPAIREVVARAVDHNMWAVIGIYTGREDNILWRRLPDEPDGRMEAAGAKALGQRDIIHSVTNSIRRLTGAIHVYGGEFFGVPRSEWDPERLVEQPRDVQRLLQFGDSNRLHAVR